MISLLSLVFFLSGTAALLFEFLWFRLAGLVFGNSVWAASLVLSSFMGGLALGNAWMASRGDGVRFPVRWYALLELAIAFVGMALVLLFPYMTNVFSPIFTVLLDHPAILNILRTLLAFLLLLIPTTAMGATLPLLVKAVNARLHNFGNVLGFLYGSNTLGAVAGVLLGEIVLIKWFGLIGTGIAAMSFNVFAALLALMISKKIGEPISIAGNRPAGSILSGKAKRTLIVGFFSGFIFLALEVIWFRFMILFFNAFSLNFAVILAVALLAISLGGFLAALWFKYREETQTPLVALLLINACLIVVTYDKFHHVLQISNSLGSEVLKVIFASLFLIFPISLNSGMIFTLLGKRLHHELNIEARTTGLLTLANTLGSALGSFIAGFALIPYLGVEMSFLCLAVLYGLLTFFLLDLKHVFADQKLRLRFLGLSALFLLAAALFPLGLMNKYLDTSAGYFHTHRREDRIAVKEGTSETVQYLQKELLDRPHYFRLLTNGHSMASTDVAGRRYMKMFVYLPVAIHPQPKKAALICFGCGMTAKALTDTKTLERIEMVDISEDVIKMSRLIFPDPSENPVHDPRVRIRIEDGRFFLQTSRERFDIITGEPPPPKYRGIVNLYTQEHFQLIRDRLAEGGIATYWLPVYMLTAENAKSILKAFCNVFPECSLWSGSGYNWMMVGIKEPAAAVSEEQFAAQWRDPAVAEELGAVGFTHPEQFGSFFIADATRIEAWTRGSLPLTDNFPGRLDDALDEGAIAKDIPVYRKFLDAESIEANFLQSKSMARIWPDAYLRKTIPYFASAQRMTFDNPASPLEFIQLLEQYMINPLSTEFDIYWLLDSDAYAQEIIAKMMSDYEQTGETMLPFLRSMLLQAVERDQPILAQDLLETGKHLAVRAVAEKDFLLAEQYYGWVSEWSDPAAKKDFNYLRIFLLIQSQERVRAQQIVDTLSAESFGGDAAELEAYLTWLATL